MANQIGPDRSNNPFVWFRTKWLHVRLPLGQVKKKTHVSRPDFYKKRERAGGFFLLFIISYCKLSLHIITFPQGYVGPCVPCL